LTQSALPYIFWHMLYGRAKVSSDLLDPKTAQFRRNLDGYINALQSGRQFVLYHYKTRIGRIGLPADMPAKYRVKAREIPFMEARDSSAVIRTSMMKEQAVIITKPVRGSNTVKARGRQKAIARNTKQVAAVWPVPENVAISGALLDLRQLSDIVQKWDIRFPIIGEVIKKCDLLKELDREIAHKQQILANMDHTEKRIAGERHGYQLLSRD